MLCDNDSEKLLMSPWARDKWRMQVQCGRREVKGQGMEPQRLVLNGCPTALGFQYLRPQLVAELALRPQIPGAWPTCCGGSPLPPGMLCARCRHRAQALPPHRDIPPCQGHGGNQTSITEFLLLGFPHGPGVQRFLFGLFSLFYALTPGNGFILGLLRLDSRLHTSRYCFLTHLAAMDMAYACTMVPQMLANLLSPARSVSFAGCMAQTFLFLTFFHTDCFLLVVMSYDRYMAICHPLRYSAIMSWRIYITLAVTSWALGVLMALVHLVLLLRLPFCGPHEINHSFCELSVHRLACADTRFNQVFILVACVLILLGPLCLVLVSYTCSLLAILRIQSEEGHRKAFSTCCFHLCVVGLYFGSAIGMYITPKSYHPEEQQKIRFLYYSLFSPMLNPLIYSLRNAEVKGALWRALCQERSP
ncbi:LOW QUALITY PROTEIN: olfactory receptor 2A1/2A42-like [Rhynchonycteris naso]